MLGVRYISLWIEMVGLCDDDCSTNPKCRGGEMGIST